MKKEKNMYMDFCSNYMWKWQCTNKFNQPTAGTAGTGRWREITGKRISAWIGGAAKQQWMDVLPAPSRS
jgi:hypothetical protein